MTEFIKPIPCVSDCCGVGVIVIPNPESPAKGQRCSKCQQICGLGTYVPEPPTEEKMAGTPSDKMIGNEVSTK